MGNMGQLSKPIWKQFLKEHITNFCNRIGSRTFSLQELMDDSFNEFQNFAPKNKHIRQKICEQLQFLREDNFLQFLENRGNYTVISIDFLECEKTELASIDIRHESPERREYIIETFVRNVAWSKKARSAFGLYCLYEGCNNTFLNNDNTPYIEVHHIIPLYRGGEDALWNLSVLCAHHHRMAHYANDTQQKYIETYLLEKVERLLCI